MSHADIGTNAIDAGVLDLLRREKARSLSAREWKFRLEGYGYAIKSVRGAQLVTRLPQGVVLGILPAHLA